jgi:multidrug/hemolysin transport system ATP-binding protein
MALLSANHLKKSFGNKIAVKDISLQIDPGKFIALLGPNGAGKSTTISMLIGTLAPDSGNINFGAKIPNSQNYHRHIGVVFQESVLDGQLTVRQNLTFRAKMYKNITTHRIEDVLNEFQLLTVADQKYQALSGGQRRRVDIARAILHRPALLFLDEPSTGLDIQTRNMIWQILNRLRQNEHLTIVLTTHYLEEAENADFVYIIDDGHVIAADTIPKLKTTYAPTRLTLITSTPDLVRKNLPADLPITTTKTGLSIVLSDSIASIPILKLIRPLISSFELRNGTVDDIFLTLTGKEIR